ncbi:TPA: hypothetical protein ACH3X1_000099 [Trebouxia sp. C0004]
MTIAEKTAASGKEASDERGKGVDKQALPGPSSGPNTGTAPAADGAQRNGDSGVFVPPTVSAPKWDGDPSLGMGTRVTKTGKR